ncbi:MAG: zinc ABC transporter substrate-binding protein [Patescibacteria group bacterium]|nr:zinc ABC transporter substrate-binding protein [Patescibacteria group bacterium]
MINFKKKLLIFLLVISFFLFTLSFINFNSLKKNKIQIIVDNPIIYDFVKNIGDKKIDLVFLDKLSNFGKEKLNNPYLILINNNFSPPDNNFKEYIFSNIYFLIKNEELLKINNNKNNFYYLFSLDNSLSVIEKLNNFLVSIDKKNKYYYDKKAIEYISQIKELRNFVKNSLKNFENKKVITTHPSFFYLLDNFKIKSDNIIYIDNLKKLSPSEILNLGKMIKKNKIEIIFIESSNEENHFIYQLANIYNLKIYSLKTLEEIDNNLSYYDLMKKNFNTIYQAFNSKLN